MLHTRFGYRRGEIAIDVPEVVGCGDLIGQPCPTEKRPDMHHLPSLG